MFRVPESCLLIIVGIAFGALLHVVDACQYTVQLKHTYCTYMSRANTWYIVCS
jgi:hypothetical protein